MIDEGE